MKPNIYIQRATNHIKGIGQKTAVLLSKTASVTIKGRKYSFHPVRTAAVIIGIIIILSVVLAVLASGIGKYAVDIPFETGSPYSIHQLSNDVMLYNNRGAIAVNSKGGIRWQIDAPLSSPLAESDGDYVLLCDLAGNHFAASYKSGRQTAEYKLGNDIISAKITSKGYTAFATDTDGYKGKVTVFNKRGREMYVWNSGGGYITDVELTENGRYLVAAQLVTDGEEPLAKIQFIDTGRGEVAATAERSGEAVVNLKFVSSNRLIAVTDKNILGYNKKGKELFCISLAGKSPSYYCVDEDLIAVVTLDNRGNSKVEMYSVSGKACGSYIAEGGVRAMTVSGSRVIVAEQRGLVTVTAKGRVKNVTKTEHDIKDIGGFTGGRAIVVGTSKAETVSVR